MFGLGIVAGLGLLSVAAVMAWKRSQSRQYFEGGGALPEPGKAPPEHFWAPAYDEPFTGDALNPATGKALYIVEAGRLVRGFAPPHMGFDISAPIGTPVFAAKGGTVVYAGRAPGYGIAVGIDHGDSSTWYAHLNQHVVREGMEVYGGQAIGEVGRTTEGPEAITTDWGRRMGAHLHFEVFPTRQVLWQYDNAERLDPARWLPREGIGFFGRRW